MSNVIYSEKAQIYGSGTDVAIEIKVNKSGTIHTIATTIAIANKTIENIWDDVKAAWNSYSWGILAPVLTVNHSDFVGTYLETAFGYNFVSIEVYFHEDNLRSFELPMIMGFDNKLQSETGSVLFENPTLANYIELPYMGTWRLQTEIDTEYGFNSQCGDVFEVNIEGEKNTDVTRKGVYSGNIFVARGMGFEITGVKFKNLKSYDNFVEFAGDDKIRCEFEWGLFDSNHTFSGYIYQPDSMSPVLTFKVERLYTYKIAMIPESHLEA